VFSSLYVGLLDEFVYSFAKLHIYFQSAIVLSVFNFMGGFLPIYDINKRQVFELMPFH
jgi:hypothetical protein